MIKRISLLSAFFLLVIVNCGIKKGMLQYVNPYIGSGEHGHIFVGPYLPFSMVKPGPDTENYRRGSHYNYHDKKIAGFSQLHLSGTGGSADSQTLSIMPTTGKLQVDEDSYSSRFEHEDEVVVPGYYSVKLQDYGITTGVTSTPRVCFYQFTFPESENSHILLNVKHAFNKFRGGNIHIVDSTTIVGFGKYKGYGYRSREGWNSPFDIAFFVKFSKPFSSYGVWEEDRISEGSKSGVVEGDKQLGAFVNYSTSEGEIINVKIGISYVDKEGAEKNLNQELPHWDFTRVRKKAEDEWNEVLGRVKVEGGTKEQKTVFYTALYHSFFAPSNITDVDGRYEGFDGKIHKAEGFDYYGEFSIWDTYRTVHPLLVLLEPEIQNHMVKSLIKMAEQGGWLPKWAWSEYYTGGMMGDHSSAIISDTYIKGITDFDVEKAYKAMRKNATQKPKHDRLGRKEVYRVKKWGNWISTEGVPWGRRGIYEYMKLGYVPEEANAAGSVSSTLEFAYNDWCVAQIAKKLDKEEDYKYFIERAHNYKNVFDSKVGFMRPRMRDGSWALDPFDPSVTGDHDEFYCEGNAWHWTWFVPHDPHGLIELMGGKETFIKRLDEVFKGESLEEAHYWHGNEPSILYSYLYTYAGAPWKTQGMVRRIMRELYANDPDSGIPGDDDVGTMSAWYVFSAMGFFPVAPGDSVYVLGSPIFDKVTINLDQDYHQGSTFVIKAENNSEQEKYIQSVNLNGTTLKKAWITHYDIVKGGSLLLKMDRNPNRELGADRRFAPPSMSKK